MSIKEEYFQCCLYFKKKKIVNAIKFSQVLFYFIDASEKSYSFEMVVKKEEISLLGLSNKVAVTRCCAMQVKLCMWEKLWYPYLNV